MDQDLQNPQPTVPQTQNPEPVPTNVQSAAKTGGLVKIIAGVIAGVLVLGGIVYFLTKKNSATNNLTSTTSQTTSNTSNSNTSQANYKCNDLLSQAEFNNDLPNANSYTLQESGDISSSGHMLRCQYMSTDYKLAGFFVTSDANAAATFANGRKVFEQYVGQKKIISPDGQSLTLPAPLAEPAALDIGSSAYNDPLECQLQVLSSNRNYIIHVISCLSGKIGSDGFDTSSLPIAEKWAATIDSNLK